jgi:hypothetical protein
MYMRICEENGPADPRLQGVVSAWRGKAESGGILIKRSGGLQWLLITYAPTSATVILDIGKKAGSSEVYYAANNRRLRAKSAKQLCTKKRSWLLMMSLARARSTPELTALRLDMP